MDIVSSIFTVQNPATFINYSAAQVAFNVIYAFVLSTLVALTYQLTHKGYSYSKNFVTSLVIICIVVTVVMMVIGNSLARAFALLGAFSIIRFRTAVKDTKDISFVFLTLVIGMAAGTNNYTIGLIGTILVLLIIALLEKINLAGAERTQYTLSIFSKKNRVDWKLIDSHLKSRRLISTSTRDSGKLTEHVFAIDLKKNVKLDELVKEISEVKGVDKIHLFSTREEIEY